MQIEVDSHTHTIASGHAYSTLGENISAAKEAGIKLLALTEHGPAMPGSPHLWFFINMRVVPRIYNGIGVLRGIEANIINEQGDLDISDELQAQLDIILASLHEPIIQPSTKAVHTKTVIKAITSGKIDVFAHGGNPAFPIDVDEVAKAASEYQVLIEINNSSFTTSRRGSIKNCSILAEAVGRHNGKITFGSDAHIAGNVGKFKECLELVKQIGFPADSIVSTSYQTFLDFLSTKKKKNFGDLFPFPSMKSR